MFLDQPTTKKEVIDSLTQNIDLILESRETIPPYERGNWMHTLKWVLCWIKLTPVSYANGCEVPPTQNRKQYIKVGMSDNAYITLYHNYLMEKFGYTHHELVYLDETSLKHQFLPDMNVKQQCLALVDELAVKLPRLNHVTGKDIAPLVYDHFATFDDALFEFNTKRLKVQAQVEEVKLKKSRWKFWK